MPERRTARGDLFTAATFRFLRELARNNNKLWFQANKPHYERQVRDPALRFIEAMGPGLARLSHQIVADSRPVGGSLFRIYRDTRFAKDKSPYKTFVGIHFNHRLTGKDERLPGFYFHLEPGDCAAMSGIWHPEVPTARKIRDAIVAAPNSWKKVRSSGLELAGDSYVRVPAGYDAGHPFAEDLKRKDFFAVHRLPEETVVAPTFPDSFLKVCRELEPLNAFLAKAIGVPW